MAGSAISTVRLLLDDERVSLTEEGFIAACRDGHVGIVNALLADQRVDPGMVYG
jgi:hypothetical protein